MRTRVLSALGIGVAALGGATWLAIDQLLPDGRPLPGTLVGGEEVPEQTPLRQWLETRRGELLTQPFSIDYPDGSHVLTLGALGVALDVDDTQERIRAHAESGSLIERLERAWAVRTGGAQVPVSFGLDTETARKQLLELEPEFQADPTNAMLDLHGHARIRHDFGYSLDIEATLDKLQGVAFGEAAGVNIVTRRRAPWVYDFMLPPVDVSKVLATHETKFAGTGRNRGKNISVAAEYLNGAVISPGETLRFNQLVGRREKKRGFVEAPVIVNDEFEPGIGGGTCQAASTLHAAAVFGMLEVVRRRSHSRPTTYLPLGLDAVVLDKQDGEHNGVDLHIRNPYDVPLLVHAYTREGNIHVELLGHTLPGEVKYRYGVVEKFAPHRRITTKLDLDGKKLDKRQDGKTGFDIRSTVTLVKGEEVVTSKKYDSRYWPVPEVYWVAPDFDLSELPPLGAQLTYAELDGIRLDADGEAVQPPPADANHESRPQAADL